MTAKPMKEPVAATGIRYTRRGSGAPLIFLHGWCLSRQLWMYAEERFAGRYDVIVPDLAGFGESQALAGPYSFERHAADIGALMDELDLRNVVLVGFAFGAAVAMTLAAKQHPRLSSIVNVGIPQASATPYERMPKSMRRDWPDFARRSAHALFHKPPSEATLAWIERMFGGTPLSVGIEAVAALARLDAVRLSGQITVPQVFIHASEDTVAPAAFGQECVNLAPSATLHVVQGSGHLIVIDGKEAFHELLDAHLEREAARLKGEQP